MSTFTHIYQKINADLLKKKSWSGWKNSHFLKADDEDFFWLF